MRQQFPIYSIAKTFFAQAVLQLELPLTKQVGDFVDALPQVYSQCTIESLLNHSAGLSDYSQLSAYQSAVKSKAPAWPRDELLQAAQTLPNNHIGFQYSNVGYLLLRMLVEKQTGLSFFNAIRELVLEPLKITGFEEWETHGTLVADYDPKWVYSGTFAATEKSLLDGYLALIHNRHHTTGLGVGLVPVPDANTGFDNPHYGFGLMTEKATEDGTPLYVGHGGGGPGYSHMILVNTSTWNIGLESSTDNFDQSQAIKRLRLKTSN